MTGLLGRALVGESGRAGERERFAGVIGFWPGFRRPGDCGTIPPSRHLAITRSATIVLALLIALVPGRASGQTSPATIVLRADLLAAARERVRAGDPALAPAYTKLLRDAENALAVAPVAVTDKRTLMPPSGDPHDYFSLSPYWWPDPSRPDGLPYVRRDGVINPESKRDLDQPRVARMGDAVQTLALAYWLSGDERYAAGAARQLRTWFLDPATRMNPHLRFAQLVRGNPAERGSGIIDTRWFVEVVDGVALIRGSAAWTASDDAAMRDWATAYLRWLRESPNGQHEQKARNNHGSWYATQTAALALLIGDSAYVRATAEAAKARIGLQIRPDGSQPAELERTRSLHYSGFNAEALSRLAETARKVGVDLWGYTAPEGGSLRAALDHLARYAGREKEWPGQQIDKEQPELELLYLRRAHAALPDDPELADAIRRLPGDVVRSDRSILLYPPGTGRAERPQAQGGTFTGRAQRPQAQAQGGTFTGTAQRPQAQAQAQGGTFTGMAQRRGTQAQSFTGTGGGPRGHPSIFLSREEALAIRAAAGKYPLLDRSLARAKAVVEAALAHPVDVPPPGEAGGYAHERHKQNYREMQLAGELYQITGDGRYAAFVRSMLEKYAVLYPTLGAHPLAKDQAPGKLFHQSLNEANWLAATAIAYDCVYDFLTPAERARFEANVFRPMADWLSVTQAKEFDRIHNHGTWATASVGMIGYVMGDTSYVNRALYGTKRDGTGGFMRQLDLLFSPDGYYMEGAYYVRYALMPFYYFAEAVQREQPGLGVYAKRDAILKKGLYSALQMALPNGVFAPINDASRTMAVTAPEVVLALDLGYRQYGSNPNLLGIAAMQDDVVLNDAGLAVARDLATTKASPDVAWQSVEFTDGPAGDRGGLGILRAGSGPDATMLLMKYGVHGQGHGHFDKLHFILFDAGREVVPDYGYARWINIEPKSGGRYLPENESWAKQTLAHNTVVVDSSTQSDGNYRADEAKAAQRNFFDASDPAVQVMSARADGFYDGVGMQRTMLLVRDRRLAAPVVVDLYRLTSPSPHQYDYALHFRGQLIDTDVRYDAHTTRQEALGGRAGYQHVWKEAAGSTDGPVRLTWLDGSRYYSLTMAGSPGTEVVFGRTGAGDPAFNLVSEPMMLVRRHAGDHLFASVIEPHGYFSEAEERSVEARPLITDVRVLADRAEGSVVEVVGREAKEATEATDANQATGATKASEAKSGPGLRWVIMVSNGPPSGAARHSIVAGGKTYEWTGNYAVEGVSR